MSTEVALVFEQRLVLLRKINDATYLMIEALKVDDFDVFSNALEQRDQLMDAFDQVEGHHFSELETGNSIKVESEALFKVLSDLDVHLHDEFLNFKKRMTAEYAEHNRKINDVTMKTKVESRYSGYGNDLSGYYIDNKK